MQNGPNWVRIIGPIVGAIILLWIVNAMVGQFSTDREEMAHEFAIELAEGGSETITGTEATTGTAATTETTSMTGTAATTETIATTDTATVEDTGAVTDTESAEGVEAVVDDAEGASVTEGNTAVDVDLDSPAIPSGDPITGTESMTGTETATGTEAITETTE